MSRFVYRALDVTSSERLPPASKGCHMRRNCLMLLATILLLPAPTAWAQGLSGALVGTVKDEQGGVLPGALVHVASPSLIGGELTTTTNEKGQLRFPVLAPGTYAARRTAAEVCLS